MDPVYVGKEYWLSKSDLPCLHCQGPILYRPLPIGISETISANGIGTRGGFCSWLCARTYADQNHPGDVTERLTTRIMLEFKTSQNLGDDPAGWHFLQKYDRFSQIPRAPPRHAFVPYGIITHEGFRENWAGVSLEGTADTFGNSISPAKTTQYMASIDESRGSLQSSSISGAIVDTETLQPFAFHRATSYSTKRQYHPSVGLNRTYWPALGIWAAAADEAEAAVQRQNGTPNT